MRDFTINTRFRFRDPLGGQLGEIPYIEIRDGKDIPPLNKAYRIHVDSWRCDRPERSGIVASWAILGTEVMLKLYCKADDPRLKIQYQADNSLAAKIIDILFLPEQPDKQSKQYRRIETETTIPKEEIPEMLRPFVTQVEKWKTFFQQPTMKELRGRHYVSVSGEGYYMAYIVGSCLRLGYIPTLEHMLNGMPRVSGFDFDPKTEPPTVFDEGIYWELPEQKILVILPHDSSNERVAAYYGYLEQFQRHMEAKKAFERQWEAAHQANKAEDEEKRRMQAEAERQALLSKTESVRQALLSP